MKKISTTFQDFKHLLKNDSYIQGLNAVPAILNMGPLSGLEVMHNKLGYSYTNFIMTFEDDLCTLYYNKDDLKNVGEQFLKRYNKDKLYFKKLMQLDKKQIQPLLKFLKKRKRLLKLPTKSLIEKYKQLQEINYKTYAVSHSVEGIGLTVDTKLKDQLTKEINDKSNFNKYLTILTQPVKRCFIHEENESLSKLLSLIYKNKSILKLFKTETPQRIEKSIPISFKNKLKAHTKKFYWIKSSYVGGVEFTTNLLIENLKDLLKEDKHLEVKTDSYFKNNKREKQKVIKQLKLSKKVADLVNIIDTATYWQDSRKELILKHCWNVTKFINELASRFKIKTENFKYTNDYDISFETFSQLNNKSLSERRDGSVYFYDYNPKARVENLGICTGPEYTKFKQAMIKEKQDHKESWEINGMCASVGTATGKVFICQTINQIQNFPKGAVLVTSMTRPEFVPAMKKAVAIVTDEGGITCHAAVISRELGLPCVIGTKTATKSLKNNQLVKVHADHGLIRIIKS
jgi:phosphohistidine swiveling domain-containing protein